ncbi:MAG TPA: hypothetical protein PKA60_00645 [Candidatus Paceibacterota bacterium]|nr:hypothetical protein [Candidatus Paceibacterota bacterium]
MNKENTETVKSVSAGSIVLWVLGFVTIITGISVGHIAVIIAGVILLPITNTLSVKYVKKNFSGMARFVIAVLLIIIGTSMSSSIDEARTSIDGQSNGVVQEEVFTEIFTLKGNGNQNSESFNITSKKARVTATTSGSSVGSFSGISLEKESGGYTGPGLQISAEGFNDGYGQTTYRNLTPGLYYIKVISGVDWSVKVEQVD